MHLLPVHWHKTLPSTNTYLADWLRSDPSLPSGTVVAARDQTAGRGRYDRVWLSSPGKDLAFSLLVRADVELAWLPALPMAVSLAVAHTLVRIGIDARVKWPNDVRVADRKICGILSEFVPEVEGAGHAVIVGVGINVNTDRERIKAVGRPATSILVETGMEMDVEAVLDAILGELPTWVDAWARGGFEAIRDDWTALGDGLGRKVTVGEGTITKTGVITGFGGHGELLLRDDEGREHVVLLGDVVG